MYDIYLLKLLGMLILTYGTRRMWNCVLVNKYLILQKHITVILDTFFFFFHKRIKFKFVVA